MTEVLSIDNLHAAINSWPERSWPKDFHNSFYLELAQYRKLGLDDNWWVFVNNNLWSWLAFRGIRGFDKPKSLSNGRKYLPEIRYESDRIQKAVAAGNLDFSLIDFSILAPLSRVVAPIKPTASPSLVFISKICHFIFPALYIVYDNEAVGIPKRNYDDYWNYSAKLWRSNDIKMELRDVLLRAIEDQVGSGNVIPNYPWSTKITELCIIGSRQSIRST